MRYGVHVPRITFYFNTWGAHGAQKTTCKPRDPYCEIAWYHIFCDLRLELPNLLHSRSNNANVRCYKLPYLSLPGDREAAISPALCAMARTADIESPAICARGPVLRVDACAFR